MSAYNSETLQHMLASGQVFTGKDMETEYAPFDIECPAIKDKCPGFNLYKADCDIRVVTEDSNEDCQRCEYGKKVAQRLNFEFPEATKCTVCGRDSEGDYKMCELCRQKKRDRDKRIGREELNRQKRESAARVRARNKEEL
jgi:hypothetical protein